MSDRNNSPQHPPGALPTSEQIRTAIHIYLKHAYDGDAPSLVADLIPPEQFDPQCWLAAETIEPTPPDAPFDKVRSFALRLGNRQYPHMKLRLSRPPKDTQYVFTVDCHDAFLTAPPDSPDHDALEELKRHNAEMASAITADWEAAGLPTERNYLRQKIQQARRESGR